MKRVSLMPEDLGKDLRTCEHGRGIKWLDMAFFRCSASQAPGHTNCSSSRGTGHIPAKAIAI